MGLSTKQVHGDGLDWSEALCQAQTFQVPKAPSVRRQQQQQNQQQQQPEACPRCESTNTKFCYYNNYNKLQPRHFCRACKRHWTKGGTLRNVPVGGGRKNKRRPRKSSTTTSHDSAATATTTTTTTTRLNNTHMAIDQTDPDHMSEALYQALIRPPSSLPPQNLNTMSSSQLGNNNDIIFSSSSSSGLSTLPFLQSMNLRFPFSSSTTSTSFDTSLPSISTSFQSSNVYNPYCEEFKAMEEPTITTTTDQPNWKVPATISTGSGMDIMSNDWNWEDIETLVSTDLNVPWDDSDHVKP